jgi:signal transduction histidine kinase
MIKKNNQFLFRSPDEIGFDNYLILVVCFVIVALGILGTLTNWALNLGPTIVISTAILVLIFSPVYLFSRIKGKFIASKFIILVSSILIVNLQWYLNYGSSGPVIFLFVIVQIFILIFFKKLVQNIFTCILVADVTVLFLVEYYNTGMFGSYPNNFDRLTDLYIGLMIILFLSIFFVNTTVKFYISEQEKAQMADKLKSAFLANMSHEIRTPMNGILGFAELLKNPNLTGAETKEYIEIIEKSGARMLNIINDIVDISKIESGLMKLDYEESNVNEQLEFIYTFFKPEVEAKGMTLTYLPTLKAEEANVNTDREKLYAILINLVKNAIKYSNKGSIVFGYQKKNGVLEFYVKDTGIGIPKNRQAAIFERFIQADIADKMARQGAGLGLAIAKAYVEMLGGKIWVESEEGIGSTFYFTHPYQN